jgi:predicted amidohydrolase YtcJ
VEKVSPWLGVHAAVTRQRPDGTPIGSWAPEQRLTPLEALLGFTSWAARAIGEPRWGSLEVGKRADLVVVDRDPLATEAAALVDAQVLLTMVDGEVVFRAMGE